VAVIALAAAGLLLPSVALARGRHSTARTAQSLHPFFDRDLANATICSAGGVVSASAGGVVSADRVSVLLTVRSGTFRECVRIRLIRGNLEKLDPFAFPGFTLQDAVGVEVTLNGAPYPGRFERPLVLELRNFSKFTFSSVVGTWNGSNFVHYPDATAAPGAVLVVFTTVQDFGFFSPG
jgi:hypothetical protein